MSLIVSAPFFGEHSSRFSGLRSECMTPILQRKCYVFGNAKSVMNIYDKTSEMVAVQLTCEGKPMLKESLTPVLMHPIRYIDHVE